MILRQRQPVPQLKVKEGLIRTYRSYIMLTVWTVRISTEFKSKIYVTLITKYETTVSDSEHQCQGDTEVKLEEQNSSTRKKHI